MHVDGCAELRPVPEKASVIKQEIDTTVAAGAPDRLFRSPPGKVERMSQVGKVLREEHVIESEVILGADSAGVHRLVRNANQDRVEPWRGLPASHARGDFERAQGAGTVIRGQELLNEVDV